MIQIFPSRITFYFMQENLPFSYTISKSIFQKCRRLVKKLVSYVLSFSANHSDITNQNDRFYEEKNQGWQK